MKKIILLILSVMISLSLVSCKKEEIKPTDIIFTVNNRQVNFELFNYFYKSAKNNLVTEAEAKNWDSIRYKEVEGGKVTYRVYAINQTIDNVSQYFAVLDLFDKEKIKWTSENEKAAKEAFDSYREGYNDKEWEKHLKQNNATEQIMKDYFVYDVKSTLLTDYLFTEKGGLKITKKELGDVFVRMYARAKNITVINKDEEGNAFTGQALEDAKQLADNILKRAKSEDFDQLTKEYSEDNKVSPGFILDAEGTNAEGEEFDPKLAELVFSLKVNEASMAETDAGIVIVKRYPNDVKYMTKDYDFLEYKLKTEKAFDFFEKKAKEAKKEINNNLLDKIK